MALDFSYGGGVLVLLRHVVHLFFPLPYDFCFVLIFLNFFHAFFFVDLFSNSTPNLDAAPIVDVLGGRQISSFLFVCQKLLVACIDYYTYEALQNYFPVM